jgi:hypothetical protein
MDTDDTLRDYARTHLLRVTSAADRALVDAFLRSATFQHLAGGFNKILEKAMHEFAAQPDVEHAPPAVDALTPLPFKDLSASAAPDAPAAAAAAAPPALFMRDVGFRLPGAHVGEPYRQPLEAVPVSEDKVCFCELSTGPGLTLAVEHATGVVTGTPASAGEHVLTVTYHYASEPGQLRHAAVTLDVDPDPQQT